MPLNRSHLEQSSVRIVRLSHRKAGNPKHASRIRHRFAVYTPRRTAATIAAQSGDVFAVQGLLGHTNTRMAGAYVQSISE